MKSSIPKRLRSLLGHLWETYKSGIAYHQGRLDLWFSSTVQLEVGRRLVKGVDEALQIFGGYGYMAEQAIEHYFRDAWAI